ncbi:hypothetical protein [Anaeromyxobacter sp. Fw109-5]|uniref:hypothetical protein n=1 Tax=Anaeromyxobacter sp. (strain Fw109-5) TaxID=404589 RepID=UPI000158A65B|nr:hypothetical protein [Anaeromyxobacter sp. Fw109-5]ABS26574.1 conserved hypothetical protein [Anaeromyxobacter sp. Fw109-5]
MIGRFGKKACFVAAVLLAACGGGGGSTTAPVDQPPPVQPPPVQPPPEDPPIVVPPPEEQPAVTLGAPATIGSWTFYAAEGQAVGVYDASADEDGNVYVAAGAAVFAKARGDAEFKAFDAKSAGLTTNCDEAQTLMCPVISVAGAQPGRAVIGFMGMGTDGDLDPEWWMSSGGADVVAFDPAAGTLARERHVFIAAPPERVDPLQESGAYDFWNLGRKKVRQVHRIAVEHDQGRGLHYGDVWFAGSHGTFSLLLANATERGWGVDATRFPGFEAAQDVWEHDHPDLYGVLRGDRAEMITGTSTALAIDPTTGDPWGANSIRLAVKKGAGARPDSWRAAMFPPKTSSWTGFYDLWPDPIVASASEFMALDHTYQDAVNSLSFCTDGTLWVGSGIHGLARRAPGEPLPEDVFEKVAIPAEYCWADELDNPICPVYSVACDPLDGSVWAGLGYGVIGRYKGGAWTFPVPGASPLFARQNPVSSIQIDAFAGADQRIVYFSHMPTWKGANGGLTVYRGP